MKGFDEGDIVEKEAKRLEVLRRRQEKELKQMVQFEMMRKELQVSQHAHVYRLCYLPVCKA